MLKTLKWVYDLGVHHERMRIAGHLQNLAQSRRDRWIAPSRTGDLLEKDRNKFAEKVRAETAREVEGLIRLILDPQMTMTESSIMFPQERDK